MQLYKLKIGVNQLKRYILFLFLFSSLLLSGLIIGCSSGDTDAGGNDGDNEVVDGETPDTSNENGASSSAVNIELRGHDFDEAEENITDLEEDQFYQKQGTNLTLPDDFPNDFPIAVGMSVDVVTIGVPGSVMGDNTEVWFNDGGNYTLDELKALYDGYINNSGFEDIEVKDFDHYMTGLTTYEGIRNDELYYIGVNPEEDYNVVTITVHREWDF